MNYDFLIIGQGLAGSLLAWQLIQQGQKVLVVDPGQENASQIAGGLINPITGKRLVKAENLEPMLATALACYQNLERHFNQRFYLEKPMLRLLRNKSEQDYAHKRLNSTEYLPFLGKLSPSTSAWNTKFGVLEQQQTGYLQTRPLLSSLKDFFIAHNSFCQSNFDYEQLQINANNIAWKDTNAGNIIFCEGYRCSKNPWFSWLPLQAVKGEILTLRSTTNLPDKIFNYGHWLIPGTTNNLYRTGATFDWDHLDNVPTEQGKQQLLTSLQNANPKFEQPEVIAQHANVRSCTVDKQPFLGHHPEHPELIIFNGFGGKGSLLIPWYSNNMVDYLIKQKPLCQLANINRFHDSHFSR